VDYFWDDKDAEKLKYSDKNAFRYHFVHQKSHLEGSGIENRYLAFS